ncbi:hypothetical protein NUSPORA_01120 [Nucleospora cyclopteri]
MDFEGNNEVGAFICLTNTYAIVGRSQSSNVVDFLRDKINFPIVETTINSINTVGNLCAGNRHGLVCAETINDQELLHIRNSLPANIRVVRIKDKLNAIGNNILCNDHVCLVNPEFTAIEELESVLNVPVYKMTLGGMPLVGTYGSLNSTGLLAHPEMNELELKEISMLLKVNTISSTANQGKLSVGSGIVVNDFMCITGRKCTNVEIKVAEAIFGLSSKEVDEKVLAEEVIF